MQSSVGNPSRTRSLRVPPAGVFKPVTASTSSTAGISYVALFLTNLRLLDLDLREDWPEISTKTFSTKDAQQNQKRRIQSVEWALYQLFALWDPEEAQNKFQPFFPPIEPLQSLNLRAALFRCLDQAKKTGVLGRDTVLRKTMLDECKGERLEEVLAVFSNAVLKKVLLQQPPAVGEYEAIALQLAFKNFSYSGERSVLSSLILAHNASIRRHLREKEESRAKYNDFSELLRLNERRILRRHEQLKEALAETDSHDRIPSSEVKSLQIKVQKNWSGSEDWLGTILHSDSKIGEDGLLATKFDRVWKHVESGSIGEVESAGKVGLLEQLDTRVKTQENRLCRWKEFCHTLSKSTGNVSTDTPRSLLLEKKKIDLGFVKHQDIKTGEQCSAVSSQMNSLYLGEYTKLIDDMRTEVAAIRHPSPQSSAAPRQIRATVSYGDLLSHTQTSSSLEAEDHVVDDDEWSSASDMEDSTPDFSSQASKSLSRTPPSETPTQNTRQDETVTVTGKNSKLAKALDPEKSPWEEQDASGNMNIPVRQPTPGEEETTLVPTEAPYSVDRALSPSPLPALKTPPTLPPPEPPKQDSESELANQILDSIAAASPSPKKPRHTLSLAERTRMSMSRTSHAQISELRDFDDIQEGPLLSIKPRASIVASPLDEEPDLHAGLIERTRKSMAGFEAAQKKAQIERRRSMKDAKKKQRESSYFPRVDEEIAGPDVNAVELLDGGDPDYESVFKSRPKIKTSPAVSPIRSRIDEEEEETG